MHPPRLVDMKTQLISVLVFMIPIVVCEEKTGDLPVGETGEAPLIYLTSARYYNGLTFGFHMTVTKNVRYILY